ncbi:MAG TPA: ABC transporter ATP-binding protein [Thermotogota bacterium]|nr:ABC transporter ATP-binding protein [Thermotogota bacterium]HPJ88969.1 ABC transporter ATP-binding protein [Thermotogota bacterium]HPR95893.1 ABC transporter ATP-binding protein [Thermotogota bacterium]
MNNILKTVNLSKTYSVNKNERQTVLNDVNIEIKKGEFVSVMGPSGSGKSTLLYSISGMDSDYSGKVNFNGNELSEMSEAELASLRLNTMGFVFQHIHLMKNLSLKDNIMLPAYKAAKKSRKVINTETDALMKKTGIASIANHDMTQASGGQLQRVGICRALINQPEILFGDEPTGALNSKVSDEIMHWLGSVNNEGTTVLLVTHDSAVAARAERVLFMKDGEIVSERYLGKYTGDFLKEREKILSQWLLEQGF